MPIVTWNPSDKSASILLSNGNLTGYNNVDGNYKSVRATLGRSTGKWYWEITCTGDNAFAVLAGVGDSAMSVENYVGATANSCGYQQGRYKMGTPTLGSATGNGTKTNGNILSLLLDVDAGSLHIWKNGNSVNPWGEMFLSLTGNTWYPACTSDNSLAIFTANFGATAFAYTPTAGYLPYDSGAIGGGLFTFHG